MGVDVGSGVLSQKPGLMGDRQIDEALGPNPDRTLDNNKQVTTLTAKGLVSGTEAARIGIEVGSSEARLRIDLNTTNCPGEQLPEQVRGMSNQMLSRLEELGPLLIEQGFFRDDDGGGEVTQGLPLQSSSVRKVDGVFQIDETMVEDASKFERAMKKPGFVNEIWGKRGLEGYYNQLDPVSQYLVRMTVYGLSVCDKDDKLGKICRESAGVKEIAKVCLAPPDRVSRKTRQDVLATYLPNSFFGLAGRLPLLENAIMLNGGNGGIKALLDRAFGGGVIESVHTPSGGVSLIATKGSRFSGEVTGAIRKEGDAYVIDVKSLGGGKLGKVVDMIKRTVQATGARGSVSQLMAVGGIEEFPTEPGEKSGSLRLINTLLDEKQTGFSSERYTPEVRAQLARFQRDGHAMVTLIGASGSGKTSMAAHLSREFASRASIERSNKYGVSGSDDVLVFTGDPKAGQDLITVIEEFTRIAERREDGASVLFLDNLQKNDFRMQDSARLLNAMDRLDGLFTQKGRRGGVFMCAETRFLIDGSVFNIHRCQLVDLNPSAEERTKIGKTAIVGSLKTKVSQELASAQQTVSSGTVEAVTSSVADAAMVWLGSQPQVAAILGDTSKAMYFTNTFWSGISTELANRLGSEITKVMTGGRSEWVTKEEAGYSILALGQQKLSEEMGPYIDGLMTTLSAVASSKVEDTGGAVKSDEGVAAILAEQQAQIDRLGQMVEMLLRERTGGGSS
jgi:hypothetical protein